MVQDKIQNYIREDDKKWFLRFSKYLTGRVLKVGNGSGYLSHLIESAGYDITTIDVRISPVAINKDSVVIYDGRTFPFKDGAFDCVVCTYVLHHTPNPREILAEITRVSNRLILLEETYKGWLSKLNLIRRDFIVNKKARQPYKIYWSSYFNRDSLIATLHNYKVIDHLTERKQNYLKELYVLDKTEL